MILTGTTKDTACHGPRGAGHPFGKTSNPLLAV